MSSLQLVCYDKNYQRRGIVGGYAAADVTPRHHAAGEASVTLPVDHPRLADLAADGARLVYRYRPDKIVKVPSGSGVLFRNVPGDVWSPIFSGVVAQREAKRDGGISTQTFHVIDDWVDVMAGMLCWPVPGSPIGSQTDAYYKASGPAETVIKTIISANATRLGIPLTVPATQGLGPSTSVQVRMDLPVDKLVPVMAGIRVRVLQVGTARTLLVDLPAVYSRTLSEASGVVQNVDPSITPPTVTRVVVGAGGEGQARLFNVWPVEARTGWTPLEESMGRVLEVFKDARDIAADDPDADTLMGQRADDELAAGGGKSSLSCDVAENSVFRYLTTFDIGDVVPVRPEGLPVITDSVTEVTVSDDAQNGLQLSPKIGAWQDSASDDLYRILASQGRAVRILQRS